MGTQCGAYRAPSRSGPRIRVGLVWRWRTLEAVAPPRRPLLRDRCVLRWRRPNHVVRRLTIDKCHSSASAHNAIAPAPSTLLSFRPHFTSATLLQPSLRCRPFPSLERMAAAPRTVRSSLISAYSAGAISPTIPFAGSRWDA